MNRIILAPFMLVANALAGCTQVIDTEDGTVVKVESAIASDNSLTMNAIDLNGLTTNAIDLNGLDPALMSPSAMSSIQDPGILGTNSRLILKYLVNCAFDATQSFSFSWTDSSGVVHNDVYWGALGLATTWKYTSLTVQQRRSVSACLGARANYYGYAVTISLRGPQQPIKHLGSLEQTAYPMEEGAFWGDLFDGTPQLYACYNSTNIANSRAKYRECAAGHYVNQSTIAECPHITIRGNCNTLCDPLAPKDFYRPRCQQSEIGAPTTELVTVFLPQ